MAASPSAAGVAAFSLSPRGCLIVRGACLSPCLLLISSFPDASPPHPSASGSGPRFIFLCQILGAWSLCCSPGLLPHDLGEVTCLYPLSLRNLLCEMKGQRIGPEGRGASLGSALAEILLNGPEQTRSSSVLWHQTGRRER